MTSFLAVSPWCWLLLGRDTALDNDMFIFKTTERYLHVKREQLVNIVSPFADLWRTGKIE
jgi:hypothetical protein